MKQQVEKKSLEDFRYEHQIKLTVFKPYKAAVSYLIQLYPKLLWIKAFA